MTLKGTKPESESRTISNSKKIVLTIIAMLIVYAASKFIGIKLDEKEVFEWVDAVGKIGGSLMVLFFSAKVKLYRIEATEKIKKDE